LYGVDRPCMIGAVAGAVSCGICVSAEGLSAMAADKTAAMIMVDSDAVPP